ncbi:hypothetical protein ACFWBB_09850 [Streptomyces sp. NPDC060000]|uniref:hypothetical protein n=1 Tax=Streptomyces sp. NPDC060000 TaxID=3347031 RepID=UPI0036C02737
MAGRRPERPVMDGEELLADGALWHGLREYQDISAGAALAHVVVAVGGDPADLARSVAELLGGALAALLPSGEGAKRLDLAGRGRSWQAGC